MKNVDYYLEKYLEASQKFVQECKEIRHVSAKGLVDAQYFVKEYSKYLCNAVLEEYMDNKGASDAKKEN